MGARRSRTQMEGGEGAPPAWMRVARPRQLPAVRAAQRSAADSATQHSQQAGSQQQVSVQRQWWHEIDTVPPPPGLRSGAAPRPAWARAWQRLHAVPAPREHRRLAWQLLHGVLPCGAWTAHMSVVMGASRPADIPHHGCTVPACAAAGAADTLSHRLLMCPVAATVWEWVCSVWMAAQGEGGRPSPPRTAAVLLAGDAQAWPAGDADQRQAWDVLRLAAIYFVWSATSAARANSMAASPVTVLAQLVHYLRKRMRQDFTRATRTASAYAAVCGSWLPHRRQLNLVDFRKRWGRNGVLCTVTGDKLHVHLTLAHPVPAL